MTLLKLMCILAHPDDETLGTGGMLAKYADEGIETHVITATRGEHGWFAAPEDYPGPRALGRIREAELRAAAQVLNVCELSLLDYEDGLLEQADPGEIIGQIAARIRRVQPQVVVTFDPFGAYGHPDHIAISQFAQAAVVEAASAHRVDKLYYFAETRDALAIYQQAFGDLVMEIDGEERRAPGWPDWAITTWLDTCAYGEQVWEAVACHQTQIPGYQALMDLPPETRQRMWSRQACYRAFSRVNGGRQVERDLFAGLR